MAGTDGNLDGKLVVLIGGSGFVGAHLAQALLKRGCRLRILSRHPERAFRLRALANLGQVQFVRGDVTRPASLAAALDGAHGVVNLVGAFAGNLDALQGQGAGRIAALASEAGVQAFVHVSALGSDAASPVDYNRTKAEGEAAVRAAFPGVTIVRPSVLFGEDDAFLNLFAGLIAKLPALPVFGPKAQLQPLNVDDAAEGIANALADPARHGGKAYDIAGPEPIAMLDLNRRIAAAQRRDPLLIALPDVVSGAFAAATEWLPGAPLSSDQWALLKAGNVLHGENGLAALGVTPRPLSLFLDRWMVRYRKHGRFGAKAAAR
ncbi:complex I NDUFA9 subunit family protein [Novosphingobium sp. Gsoil 351]|uniref:complex I NDUFA9 subunit family protein n=1 Tax=Novosphingobium sp. Gsoil 351 TaxID=2675225 RepID=UPI0012B4D2B7|nr:complex I NDUFA9 subunit family protein [Novosphingobium sp. Gsoil 351]QGN55542.1 NAD(P)H-binding protein [Novosphingobium sp. Gsoil 351]